MRQHREHDCLAQVAGCLASFRSCLRHRHHASNDQCGECDLPQARRSSGKCPEYERRGGIRHDDREGERNRSCRHRRKKTDGGDRQKHSRGRRKPHSTELGSRELACAPDPKCQKDEAKDRDRGSRFHRADMGAHPGSDDVVHSPCRGGNDAEKGRIHCCPERWRPRLTGPSVADARIGPPCDRLARNLFFFRSKQILPRRFQMFRDVVDSGCYIAVAQCVEDGSMLLVV